MGIAVNELNTFLQEDVDQVLESVEQITGVTHEQILSSKRNRFIVDARKILSVVIRTHLKLTCFETGKIVNKDHTSVIHYERMHPTHMGEPEYRRLYSAVCGTFLIRKSVQDEERLQDQFLKLQRSTKRLLTSLEGSGKILNLGMEEIKNSA